MHSIPDQPLTRCRPSALVLGLLLAAATGQAPAQSISGQITDASTGQPVAGVAVILFDRNDRLAARVLSDSEGRYRIQAPQPGSYRLRFEIPGYRLVITEFFDLKRDQQRDYPMRLTPAAAVALDTVVVGGEPVPRHLLDFFLRKGKGLGTFLTPADIERLHPGTPTDLVRRLEGFDLSYDRFDPTRKLIRNKRWGGLGRACAPAIFVDGAYVGTADSYDMDTALWVDRLDAIESYSNAARVPIEFNATGSECGVIAVWTKRQAR